MKISDLSIHTVLADGAGFLVEVSLCGCQNFSKANSSLMDLSLTPSIPIALRLDPVTNVIFCQ